MKLQGPRVLVRAALAREADLAQQLIAGLPRRDDSGCTWERHVIERTSDGTVVGIIEHWSGDPADEWATFGAMVMSEGDRGWGFGSEAVRLIEDRLAGRDGTRRMRALIDKRIGLALYFWVRQGYRPAAPDEVLWPDAESSDIISVVRSLEE